ncbi:MAG: ABC transporter permease [Clostridia bacterium]|nr:ABC transporter permease [Clostridia bacterium]
MEQNKEPVSAPKQHRGLPFHIIKRVNIPIWKKITIYAVAIVGGLLLSSLICAGLAGKNPLDYFTYLFKGAFGTERKIWLMLLDAALLLGASMALIPAFKMRFWNLGGNGQMLVACLSAYSLSYFLGDKVPEWLLILLMFACSILSGIVWSLIPALFKAFFNTNETLFTLMMNYIATGIVLYCRASWITSGSAQFPTLTKGTLPEIYNNMLPTVAIFVLLTLFMFVYLKYSKHGYEISVVGESVNTAKYIGINVKKVIIRTMILSGAIAGLVGFILIARTGPGLSSDTPNNMGFTAIMTSWLANFSPLLLFLSCFFISFITRGMSQVQQGFGLTNNSIISIVTGLIYFCVIACSFFINYKIVFRKKEGK